MRHLSWMTWLLFAACNSQWSDRTSSPDHISAGQLFSHRPPANGAGKGDGKKPGSCSGVIPLTIAAGPALENAPLHTGIPFPTGVLRDLHGLRLEDGQGDEIDAQFGAIAHWPDGSIKSVLVSFLSDVGPERVVQLQYGHHGMRTQRHRAVHVQRKHGKLSVDTGLLEVVFDTRGLMTSVKRRGEGAHGSKLVLSDQDLYFESALDGQTYLASLAHDAEVTIEEHGPVRATIRAKGTMRSPSGALVSYQLRSSFYAGSDIVDVEASIIDERLDENVLARPPTFALAGKRLGLRWGLAPGPTRYRFGGDAGIAEGWTTGPVALRQRGTWAYDRSTANGTHQGYTFSYQGVATGGKAQGWMTADSPFGHVQVMVRDFWQQYPGALELDRNEVSVALFDGGTDTSAPPQSDNSYKRANSFYFDRYGGAKTYQVRLRLPAKTEDNDRVVAANDRYQAHRLDVMAPLAWYADSKVFGDYEPASTSGTGGYDAVLMENIYVPSMTVFEGHVPLAITYGWRDFGDRLRWRSESVDGVKLPAFYNDSHVGANGFLHEFIRTGDQRYFELGETATRHFRDIDVWHNPRAGYWETGGIPQPAGEEKLPNHSNVDHEDPRIPIMHWGHAHVSGMTDLYLLTGDRRSFEVLSEVANWWRFMRPHAFQLPFDFDALHRESERDFAWPLYVMMEWVRVTGDAEYHAEVSAKLVQYMVEWWQTPREHIGYNPVTDTVSSEVVGINDASQGTGYWTMTLMDNSEDVNGDPVPGANGANPWMAAPMLTHLLQFLDQDAAFATVGKSASPPREVVLDMLFQCMNYLVIHGWDNEVKWFFYSEVTRNDWEGLHQILYPIVRLDQEYKTAIAAGLLPHPEWYDTQPMWLPIAQEKYDLALNLVAGEASEDWNYPAAHVTGWYGYELVYPIDFFAWMKRAQ